MHEQTHARLIEGLSHSPLVRAASKLKWLLFRLFARVWPRGIIHIHEPPITRVFWESVRPGMTVVDIGAHHGLYTVLAAARAGPTGRVFAFEPEPVNHERLLQNTRRFRNVCIVKSAVSERDGEARLNLDGYHGSHSLLAGSHGAGSTTVATTTLDSFLAAQQLPAVDLVKIDVEGAELLALSGMVQTLASCRRPIILCEVHPPHTPDAVASFLQRFGYRSQLLDAQFSGAVHAAPVHLLARPASPRNG